MTVPLDPIPGADYAECPDCGNRLMILPGSSTTIEHVPDGTHWVRFDDTPRAERADRPAIDRERLARALHAVMHGEDAEWWESHPLSRTDDYEEHQAKADAIAAAYEAEPLP